MIEPDVLDQRFVIEAKSVTRDPDFGTEIVSWATVAAVWGRCLDEINPKRGGDELVENKLRTLTSRSRIRIRYLAGITTDMRVRWPDRGRTFQITSKAEIGRRERLELSCEEYSS